MKRFALFYIAVGLIFQFLLPHAGSAADKTYVLSYSPGTLIHQLIRDRAKEVYAEAGLNAEFVPLPHNRSLISANRGSVDGDVGRVPSVEEKYPNLVRVGEKLMDLEGAVYTLKPEIRDYDDSLLTNYRVGYVLGVRWPQKKMAGLEATTAPNYEALFEMLLQGRIDIALATVASADYVINDLGHRGLAIRQLKPPIFSAPIYHYVHEKNRRIVPLLEQAVRNLNRDRTLEFYTGVQSPLFEISRARIREACSRIGLLCTVKNLGSSERALYQANWKGDGDVMRVADIKEIATDMTGNLVQVSESIISFDVHAYSSGKVMDIKDWSSLEGLRNGARKGAKILEKKLPGELTLLPTTKRLLMMLQEDRLDTVSEHSDVVDYLIEKHQLKGITRLDPALAVLPGFPYLHEKHRELVPRLAAALAEMKADGTYERLKTTVLQKLLTQE